MKVDNILQTIGNTPHVRINQLFRSDIEVWMKVERFNPGSSIKDRIALAMIEEAETKGLIDKDTVIIEPTSGNTGIGLALVCAVKGYRLILTMPESMSIERRKYMKALGAELVLTPKELGMGGTIAKANELLAEYPKSWMPQQFNNAANVEAHRNTTAREILADFPEGIDYLITGVGTGGHITGCSEALKQHFPQLQTYAVEPEKSPVISGGQKGLHRLQGIGAGFIPQILNRDTLDGTLLVSEESAFDMARQCALKEGIFVGISSGASLAAIAQKQADMKPGSRVLVFSYDTGERYLSIEDLF
ncbi:cysteine synthase A [Cellvibrio japonicus]|uniref:Cysteine synthase n=1 Tax=Cellvibrio japonicus (strain Ueda107) TaxID=498211 RepID=B3PBK1_CELJU|nr:cysteine synthase A [Cellvibrio japonicus]ACE83624.1 cysteine synthase A [Cellvibrio japonicus Ueda107]QEI13114.1 cysteine synthase A [Cellvibrio japonicus]QEI16688.1 cysteine synthase A [Cellvibrio japonicus]QEI20266.1 cysteine synthase A [Cellvibrio japonicus]